MNRIASPFRFREGPFSLNSRPVLRVLRRKFASTVTSRPSEIHSRSIHYRLLVLVFLLERALLYALGLRCQLEGLSWYWQILDPGALRDHLAESLLYLHAQPPLFNLLTGIMLKLGAGVWAFSLLCTLTGLLMLLVLHALLRELGWSDPMAALLLLLLAGLPGWILYEQWYFYDFSTALLLATAALSLLRWGRHRKSPDFAVFLSAITALAMLRSIFHLLWLAAGIVIVAMVRMPEKRRLRAAMLLPLLLVGGWYFKNLVVFGFFGASSWMGMSLAKMSVSRLSPDEAGQMLHEDLISPISLVRPFSPVEDYERAAHRHFENSPIFVLGSRYRRKEGPNYNHQAYLGISRICRGDSLRVIREHPKIYWAAVATAIHRFFTPISAYPAFQKNLTILAPVARLEIFGWDHPPISTILFLLGYALTGLSIILEIRAGHRETALFYLFLFFCISWVFCAGNMLEVGENERFRAILSPLILIGLAGGLNRIRQLKSEA